MCCNVFNVWPKSTFFFLCGPKAPKGWTPLVALCVFIFPSKASDLLSSPSSKFFLCFIFVYQSRNSITFNFYGFLSFLLMFIFNSLKILKCFEIDILKFLPAYSNISSSLVLFLLTYFILIGGHIFLLFCVSSNY